MRRRVSYSHMSPLLDGELDENMHSLQFLVMVERIQAFLEFADVLLSVFVVR